MNFANCVIGYHGCPKTVADRIFSGEEKHLKCSSNDYDWLGNGVYFWENSRARALEWAEETIKRKKLRDSPAVVGAVIIPYLCLDLTVHEDIRLLSEQYELMKWVMDRAAEQGGEALLFPENQKAGATDNEMLLRYLDCTIIECLHIARTEAQVPAFDTVRGAFPEGAAAFSGSMLRSKTHIQWAVRDPKKCILGYFRPLD